MKLTFVYLPVRDLKEAVAFYRDAVGLAEAWREGEIAAAFALDGTDVQLVVGIPDDEADNAVGPLFVVDDVNEFVESHRDSLNFRFGPRDVPPGLLAAFEDPAGNLIRVMDLSKEGG